MLAYHEGEVYEITFEYTITNRVKLTECTINKVTIDEKKKSPKAKTLPVVSKDLFVYGQASCWHKDQFNKAIGRKIALTNALADVEDREFRRSMWQAYLQSGARLP